MPKSVEGYLQDRTVRRLEQVKRLLSGAGPALTVTEIARECKVGRKTTYEDLKRVRALVPAEEKENLASNSFLLFDRATTAVLAALQDVSRQVPDPDAPGRTTMKNPHLAGLLSEKLVNVVERRVRVAQMLSLIPPEPPKYAAPQATVRMDAGRGILELMLNAMPELSEDQQVAFIKKATLVAQQDVDLGVKP